jgi:Zn-dependent protease
MILLEPNPSRYDLAFTFLNVPVRVSPWFWLVMGLFGLPMLLDGAILAWLIWIAVAFVSIVVHEYGHALAARAYGMRPHIVLYAFGGLASWFGAPLSRNQKIAVALAGPAAGFALWGVTLAIWITGYWPQPSSFPSMLLLVTLWYFWIINLSWNLLNLLPVWPLDGGQVSRELFNSFDRRAGEARTYGVGMIAAIGMVVLSLFTWSDQFRPTGMAPLSWLAVLFGLLAWQNWQMYKIATGRGWMSDRLPWER